LGDFANSGPTSGPLFRWKANGFAAAKKNVASWDGVCERYFGHAMNSCLIERQRDTAPCFQPSWRPFVAGFLVSSILANCAMSQTAPATCVQPDAPICIDKGSTYDNSQDLLDCKTDVTRYIASVQSYRTCMEDGASRAILEANKRIDQFKANVAAKPTPSAPPIVSHVSGRPLLLNGSGGELRLSFSDSVLRVKKMRLAGSVVSDPARPCEIDVVSESALETRALARVGGLERYSVDLPACPFTFAVLDGAVLASSQSGDCVFQAADCRANPSGLWGLGGRELAGNAELLQAERSRAEAQVNIYVGGLTSATRDVGRLADLKRDQIEFLTKRREICDRYFEESVHGYCSLQVTLARAAYLKTRLEELPGGQSRKQKH
jgi:hypothetical protein